MSYDQTHLRALEANAAGCRLHSTSQTYWTQDPFSLNSPRSVAHNIKNELCCIINGIDHGQL